MPRGLHLLALDTLDLLLGRRKDLVPPHRLRYVGPGDFREIGERALELFREQAGLQPNERVLDLGCGVGRMAIPLTRYLEADAAYDGLDIVPQAIRWCQRSISRKFPNFRFHLADIHHPVYNAGGKLSASSFQFPYPSASFDFAFLTSVFTHLLDKEMEHYLDELKRVLRPGGRLLISYFLLNPESEQLIAEGRSDRTFPCGFGEYRAAESERPELAVAYREEYVRRQYELRGLSIREPPIYGNWCGRKQRTSYQDVVVAERTRR